MSRADKPHTGPRGVSRRRFVSDSLQAAGISALLGLGVGAAAARSQSAPQMLRPPGALADGDFLSACVRCGLCVRACPYDILHLASWFEPAVHGTPVFEARTTPCEMCEDIPCVKACPSGALDPALQDIEQARMGLAVLIDREHCLNLLGLRCDVCYRVCPMIDEAISLQARRNERTGAHAIFEPVVHSDFCTGCGKCEHACVLEQAAIKVLPQSLASGAPDAHYRLGWEEQRRAGKSLTPGLIDLPDRLPAPVEGQP